MPYSAWSLVAWALGHVVRSPELSGKLFFLLSSVVFVGGASYAIRSVQGRPTAIEYLPLAWVYDRYVYDGILNYHLSVGICLLAIGYLHRSTRGGQEAPPSRALAALACLGVATYLSHILGWLCLCLGVATYSCAVCLRRRNLDGFRAVASMLPAGCLLGWYLLGRSGPVHVVLYPSLATKMYTWAPVFLLFFRLEPFGIQPPVPLALNLAALGTMASLVVGLAARRSARQARPVFDPPCAASALACLVCAALIPFYLFAGMGPPDARFLQPAMWLGVACVRYRPVTRRHLSLVVALVTLVWAVNLTQFARVQPLLAEAFDKLRAAIPADARVYSVSLRSPPHSLRDAVRGRSLADFTVGLPMLDYFDLYRFMHEEQYDADLGMFAVGLLRARPSARPPQLALHVLPRTDLEASADAVMAGAATYDFVELFGDADDIRLVGALLASQFRPAAEGTNFLLLARR